MFTRHKDRATGGSPTLLLALATLLGLSCSLLFGADPSRQQSRPRALPSGVEAIAQPITCSAPQSPLLELQCAIEAHQTHRLQDAVISWRHVTLANEQEVWRHIGLGVAHLYLSDLEAAESELSIARAEAPNHPLAHYFTGLLRHEQARLAADYFDSELMQEIRLVRVSPPAVLPAGKTQSRLFWEAMDELELSIRLSDNVDLQQPLVTDPCDVLDPLDTAQTPTVGDLVDALGGDNFVGKAHGLLAVWHLDQERPDAAENHVSQAESFGIPVPLGFRRVGQAYEAQGRHTDALRAYFKAIQQGDMLAQPGATVEENMKNGFERLF